MLVQRVVIAADRREPWSVLGDDGIPVTPVERYLAYLTDTERSPNTVKAYAHDLKDGVTGNRKEIIQSSPADRRVRCPAEVPESASNPAFLAIVATGG